MKNKIKTLPEPEQLAMLAAALARSIKDKPEALVNAAMDLWWAAKARIVFANEENEVHEQLECFPQPLFLPKPAKDSLFKSEKRPISRDRFLRIVLPQYKGRTADRARIAKDFLRDTWRRTPDAPPPTQDDVIRAYGEWKPYTSAIAADRAAKHFESWYKHRLSKVRSAAGSKNKSKSGAKKTRKARPRIKELREAIKKREEPEI